MSQTTPMPMPSPSPQGGRKGKTKSPEELVTNVSSEAQAAAGAAPGATSGKTGLVGIPVGTKVRVGEDVVSAPPQFAGGRPVSEKRPTFKTIQYDSTSAATMFASMTTNERAELLLNLSSIPGLYAKNTAPTREYVLAGLQSKTLGAREEDINALEKVMYYADTVGEDVETSVKKFVASPSLAQSYFDARSLVPKKPRLTPELALATELDQSLQDFLDVKADKKAVKQYVEKVNKLETSRGAQLTATERQQLLIDFVQNEARKRYATEADSPDSMLTRQGALGGTFNYLKQVRNQYNVKTPDSEIYKEAINSIRSRQALDNIVNKIKLQAEINMPALKNYFQQGLTARDALSNYISLKSKTFGIPEEQVTLDELAPVYSGTNLMSLNDWQQYLFKTPEFKQSPLYKQQQLSDYRTLVRNFIGQAG